jgi:hypothetical protein
MSQDYWSDNGIHKILWDYEEVWREQQGFSAIDAQQKDCTHFQKYWDSWPLLWEFESINLGWMHYFLKSLVPFSILHLVFHYY